MAHDAFVPSAVIDKALVHDMVYAGCPRCFASVGAAGDDASAACCRSCGASFRSSELQHKYRLKLQVAFGDAVEGAVLFDEAARALVGVPAAAYKRALLPQHPRLPYALADLLEGLHVAFYLRQQAESVASSPQYTKDLKVVRMVPLTRELLPRPAVPLALELLVHGRALLADERASADEISDLSTQ